MLNALDLSKLKEKYSLVLSLQCCHQEDVTSLLQPLPSGDALRQFCR